MTATVLSAVVVWLVQGPPTADLQARAQALDAGGDHAAAAEVYLQLAAQPGVDPQFAIDDAHQQFVLAFKATGEPVHLCRALDVVSEALATETTPDFAAYWRELHSEDAAALDARLAELGQDREVCNPVEADVALLPVARPPVLAAPVQVDPPVRAPRRRFVAAGWPTLVVGMSLTTVAVVSGINLHKAAAATRQAPDPASWDVANDSFKRWLPSTVATAVLGASATIAGAVLLGLGYRKQPRRGTATRVVPTLGGVVLTTKF